MDAGAVSFVEPWQLRARFARSLSAMYGREVPAYATLVDVTREVNEAVVAAHGTDAERLGSLDRVSAERHGAIRLGTPRELAEVARVFGAMGMFAVGFYDLRDAAPSPVPVVSTAFRPIAAQELARNPFRVFTSLLAVSDRRFFTRELQHRLERFLDERRDGARLYDELTAEQADVRRWSERFPASERELAGADLAFFEYELVEARRFDGTSPPADVAGLIEGGWVTIKPIVYEDFLPRSAAGIFQSNLAGGGSHDSAEAGADLDAGWMADALGRELADPISLYAAQRERSLDAFRRALALDVHAFRS